VIVDIHNDSDTPELTSPLEAAVLPFASGSEKRPAKHANYFGFP